MSKITAIHSGGDWSDASATYLILPPNMNINDEYKKYRQWYVNEYCKPNANIPYLTLDEWCIKNGARISTDDELEVFTEL